MIYSCTTPPLDLRRNLRYCYNTEENNSDSILNLNGIYQYSIFSSTNGEIKKGFKLFRDGTIIEGMLEDFDKGYFRDLKNSPYYYTCGYYKVNSDTLHVQFIINSCNICSWSGYEEWYKIIDRNTMKLILTKELRHSEEYREASTDNYYRDDYSLVKFKPYMKAVDSTFRFKKYKWFWCNEEKWRQYKKNLKSKK